MVNVGNWGGFDGARDEVNLIAFDVLNNHDLFLGQEVKGKVADCFSQNALL
jgi:hypothetical protein